MIITTIDSERASDRLKEKNDKNNYRGRGRDTERETHTARQREKGRVFGNWN